MHKRHVVLRIEPAARDNTLFTQKGVKFGGKKTKCGFTNGRERMEDVAVRGRVHVRWVLN